MIWRRLALCLLSFSLLAEDAPKKTVIIRFFAQVNEQSVNTLLRTVDEKLKIGTERFVLLISSPGGNVFYGMSAYNYLRGIPAEVVTHNFGQVDSIAALLYCAGTKRYSVPQGEFLLHGLSVTLPGAITFEHAALGEQLQQMENQVDSIAKVIAASTGQKVDQVRTIINTRTVLSAEAAKKMGLVQEIKAELIPAGAEVVAIQSAANMPEPNHTNNEVGRLRFWAAFPESSITMYTSSISPFAPIPTLADPRFSTR